MKSGTWLWARHNNVPWSVLTAVVASVIVKLLSSTFLETDGTTVDIDAFWVSVVAAIPLLFLFTSENDIDRVSARSLPVRRTWLLIIAIVTAATIGLLCFPGQFTDFGAIAVIRNIVGLVGLGLVSLLVVPTPALWVLPVTAAAASLMFSWPYTPSTTHSLWGALRAPGQVHMSGGSVDLSVEFCLAIGFTGAMAFLIRSGSAVPIRFSGRDTGATTAEPTSESPAVLIRRGFLRATFAVPVAVIMAVLTAWILLSDPSSWLGSPRLLLRDEFPNAPFIFFPLAVTVGVICGQARWRSGVTIWEQLSSVSAMNRFHRTGLLALGTVLIPVSTVLVFLLVVSVYGAAVDGLSPGTVFHEVAAGIPLALTTLVLLGAGALIGTVVGHRISRIWVAPAALVVAAALFLVIPTGSVPDTEQQLADRYGYTTCTTTPENSTEICTTEPNSGYLNAASTTVDNIYAQSVYRDVLPKKIILVNTVFDPVPGDTALPAIGLQEQRSVTAPRHLDESRVLTDLDQSLSTLCTSGNPFGGRSGLPDLTALRNAFRPSEGAPDPAVVTALRQLSSCTTP